MSTSSNRLGCVGVFVVVLLCLSLLLNAGFLFGEFLGIAGGFGDDSKFRERVITQPGKNITTKIAVVRLKGMITNYMPGAVGHSMVEDFKLQIKQATDDKNVSAIVVAVDSPGGEVTASDELYTAVKKAKEKKPVVITMGGLAASGGYYVAIGGSYIFANETTFTGSIGVIMQTYNYEGLFDKVGLRAVTYKSGAFKDMMSGSRAATPAEVEYINGLVMQTYARFVGLVAKERNLPEEELRKGPADGRVISGKDALALKLVDALGDFDAAVAKAMELGKAPNSAVIGYDVSANLSRYLRLIGKSSDSNKIEVNFSPTQSLPLQPGYLYMIPSHLAQ